MSLGERLREMLDPGATVGSSGPNGHGTPPRRRSRSQAQPVNPVRGYDADPGGGMPRAQWIWLLLAAAAAVALTAGLVFLVLTILRQPAQTATATPTPLPAVASPTVPSSVAQIFATSTPSLSAPTASPQPSLPQQLQVTNTGGEGANLRRDPGQSGEKVKTVAEGALVEIVGPDRTVDGTIWRNVRDLQGDTGWIAASFLAAEGSVPVAAIPGATLGPSGGAITPVVATPRPTTGVAPAGATRGQVGNTGGQGANIRSEPGTSGRILKTLAEGATIEVLGPEREVDGQIWRQVRDSAGVTGWIVRGAVAPAGSVPTPVPGATRVPGTPATKPSTGATAAPATKPSTGATAPAATAAPAAKPTSPPGDLPIIIQPATPRPAQNQVQATPAPPTTQIRTPVTGGTPRTP